MCVHRARIPGQPSAAVQLSSEDLVEAPQQQAAAGSWAARSPQLQPQLSTVARVAAAHGSTEAAYTERDTVSLLSRSPSVFDPGSVFASEPPRRERRAFERRFTFANTRDTADLRITP